MIMPVPFVSASHPFEDFVLAHGVSTVNDAGLNQFLERSGFVRQVPISGLACAVYSKKEIVTAPNGGILLSGYGQQHGRFFYGTDQAAHVFAHGDLCPENSDISSAAVGNFTAIAVHRDKVNIFSDPLGMSLIFIYRDKEDRVLISNSYHLLLLCIKAMRVTPLVDRHRLLLSLLGRSTFFAQNVSAELPVSGVLQVPLDRYICISRDRIEFSAYRSISEALLPDPAADIDGLLRDGVEQVLQNTRAVFDHPNFDYHTLHMSGGIDSRVVLAAILQLGELARSKTYLEIKDRKQSSDLRIACGIADRYGLSLFPGDLPPFEKNPAQSSAHWRSYKMGLYFRAGGGSGSSGGTEHQSLQLSGGNGELTRSFWRPIYRRHISPICSLSEFVSSLCDKEFKRFRLAREDLDGMKQVIYDSIKELPGDDLLTKIDSHYHFYRNRYHFGCSEYHGFHVRNTWMPLMSLSLLRASRTMSADLRLRPIILLRATEMMSESLPWIEYDGGVKLSDIPIDKLPIPAHLRKPEIALKDITDPWYAIQKDRKKLSTHITKKQLLAPATTNTPQQSFFQQMADETIEATQSLLSLNYLPEHIEIEDEVRHEFASKGKNHQLLYGKLTSAYDQLSITGAL